MDWWPKQLFTTPQHWLTLHTPLWFDMEPVNVISQWHDDWTSASVVNCDLVHNPTIRLPGFGLPRRQWCTLLLQNKPRTLWHLQQALGPGYGKRNTKTLCFFCIWVRVDRGYEITWVRVDLVGLRVDFGYELTVNH